MIIALHNYLCMLECNRKKYLVKNVWHEHLVLLVEVSMHNVETVNTSMPVHVGRNYILSCILCKTIKKSQKTEYNIR